MAAPSYGTRSRAASPAASSLAAGRKSQIREWTEAIGGALILTLVIRTFMFQAFRIPSGSMLDTLQIGDFLFVNKLVYGARIPFTPTSRLPGLRHPTTGDIVVFQFPLDRKTDYIKRVIASEGQTVEIRNKVVFVDGKALVEPYTKHIDPTMYPYTNPDGTHNVRDNDPPFTVPAGNLFCMGDNRENSSDGRFWGFVPYENVKGKALIIYWSWDADHVRPRLNRLFRLVH